MLRIVSFRREQDGGGEGGCGAHLSPQIHQEYTFRHRSACRTPAESRQEQLTSRKVYVEPCKTRDQTLSLWRWSTDSKTLDYQRTNPAAAAAAKSLQSCPTLYDPIDSSPPGSPVPGILQYLDCHFLLQCMKVKSESEVVSDS